MTLHHRLLAGAYYPFKLTKTVERSLGLAPAHRLRVLLYHDIAPHDLENFAAQLRWLARSWSFVSAERFAAMVSGAEPTRGSHLLLTFDDGFASNRVVAEAVLSPMGIRAVFFVVSDLVDLVDRDEARNFIAQHLCLVRRADQLPAHWSNMGWADLEALLEQGHCIGGHTRTHARLSEINAESDLECEIIASADTLAGRLGVPIEHFAYPFGDLASFSPQALAVARRRFGFIHSGLRGDNAMGVSPFALRRDASAVLYSSFGFAVPPNHLLGAFLEGAADTYYGRWRAQLDAWNLAVDEGLVSPVCEKVERC